MDQGPSAPAALAARVNQLEERLAEQESETSLAKCLAIFAGLLALASIGGYAGLGVAVGIGAAALFLFFCVAVVRAAFVGGRSA